ncbi:hypothetical protein IGI04_016275 [Brassica rapa subsp. trilocularis]|uniref:non-specific serine/threonine protein kinase n=1 Tax=Brassica rapa subsp. trilocularis TaxID=1813537 RepID=A0ABQ7MTT6_BRACM|nr:hypothetical protein IGI04_016275 [Brassica rapa subsp. trilocularis]
MALYHWLKTMQCDSGGCRLELVRTPKSTLPPLINALEAYTVIEFPKLETSPSDVDAIKNIKVTYRLSKISWQGDPCLPKDLSWENIRCSYVDLSTPSQIVSLNLSESGLTGSMALALQNLTQLQELDLSNNNLTGPVPSFLASMKTLSLINLSGNNLNGSVPQALLDRVTEGLVLKLDGNPDLCKTSLCNPKKQKKKFLIPAFASAASLLAILVVVALVFVFRKKKLPSDSPAPPSIPVADIGHTSQPESSFPSKKIRFTYTEVQQMTNNFERALGEGGFGVVYDGCVNVTQQVAVKLLSQSSSQGYKHFKAELFYRKYRKRGGLVLSWENRLRIVLDTALGLEYLHTGCIPPIVHRDIKSTNILLDQNFQAKLADFGLSRSFPTGNETHVSTVVAGTPGYLDPEYYQTNWLTEKSDIYSFGIVLLEIITNRPIIQQSREKPHLVEWVSFMITKGDIGSIMDPNLHQNYDIGSVWKAIEIAMSCLSPSSIGRPNMSQVAKGLKECLISENSRISESRDVELRTSIDYSKDMYTESLQGLLLALIIVSTSPLKCLYTRCTVELVMTQSSTLPPMVNAMEAYMIMPFPDAGTNPEDAVAVQNVKDAYELNRIDWQGDPCVPRQFKWEGVNCSYTNASVPQRIISLDLSSSGLNGVIASSIQNLTHLQELDLSNNNLSGGVPELLANMESLLIINLGWNSLAGPIPQALRDREKKGLKLTTQGNPNLCLSGSCNNNKKVLVPVIASVASVLALIALLVLFYIFRKKRPLSEGAAATRELPRKSSIFSKKKRFTYSEVVELTDNFKRVLGEGGFGAVYHGSLSDTEPVAVKVLSESSVQGYKEFKAEVELLLRVHHVNLVSLVGYCDEGGHLALIYEYMENGNLKQHLSGQSAGSTLKWASRLKIAVEAAQGLEYLHVACEPPMVHRDVKSTNILLDDRFDAKLADFGLSRSFSVGAETQVVAGTSGYLDPDFGIVLMEIITNRSVIERTRVKAHIAEWLKVLISRGDVVKIVDPNLGRDYDSNIAWTILELAISCVSHSSSDRPNMSKVVNMLKECLVSENLRTGGQIQDDDSKNFLQLTVDFGTQVTPAAR